MVSSGPTLKPDLFTHPNLTNAIISSTITVFLVWYGLPTNSPTSYPSNNRISWISMRKKIGLQLGPTFGWDPLPVRAHYWLGPTFGQGPP
jgi:hypothetical protein